MPRPHRVQFAGAVYHVMNRAVRGAPLYTDDEERRHFLDLLDVARRRYAWQVYGYCLMGNHYHLLLATPKPTLSRGMQWLNGGYARWFSRRHDQPGHALFRRFHSVVIETDTQLVDTVRYILRNPVEACLCAGPQDWAWSSYRATVGAETAPPFLSTGWIAEQFGADAAHARANFAAFICAAE